MTEGLSGLFLSALLAATLIPFSSEALMAVLAASGDYPVLSLFLAASAGNILGSTINWALGRYCVHYSVNWRDRKWFPFSATDLERASQRFNRYGVWSLLLAWVPVIGDPITFAAGVLKVPLPRFLILVSIGKMARYAVLLGLLQNFWP